MGLASVEAATCSDDGMMVDGADCVANASAGATTGDAKIDAAAAADSSAGRIDAPDVSDRLVTSRSPSADDDVCRCTLVGIAIGRSIRCALGENAVAAAAIANRRRNRRQTSAMAHRRLDARKHLLMGDGVG